MRTGRGGHLFDNAGPLDRLDEREGGTVAAGHFGPIDPNFAIVYLHAGQGRHDVLDHLHGGLAGTERGAPRHLHPIGHRGLDLRAARQIAPHEDDPAIDVGRPELDAYVSPAPITDSVDGGRSR